MNIEEIKKTLESEISSLNDQSKKLDIINNGFKAYYEKDVKSLIERCEYRIGNLENAHKYSNVANHEEIDRDTTDLNAAVTSLNNEVMDLETIKKNIGIKFEIAAYDSLAKELISVIDTDLENSNRTIRNATAVLNNKFDEVEKRENVEVPVVKDEKELIENPENIMNPQEIKTDSLDQLTEDLNKELEPIKDDKKELEEAIKVTNVEDVKEEMVAPVLMPQEDTKLNVFTNDEVKPIENVVAPVVETSSAASVDEGFVKVTDVLTFGQEQVEENDGPVLSRTVA